MQYGNKLPSAYSELKIELLSVSNENKEKLGELNKNIDNQITTIEKTMEEIKSTIPTIPSDLNSKWETVKADASREIPTIPSDLNEEWETLKEKRR
jgi:vacuolar-type H+-ATPase subunit I/STV1